MEWHENYRNGPELNGTKQEWPKWIASQRMGEERTSPDEIGEAEKDAKADHRKEAYGTGRYRIGLAEDEAMR